MTDSQHTRPSDRGSSRFATGRTGPHRPLPAFLLILALVSAAVMTACSDTEPRPATGADGGLGDQAADQAAEIDPATAAALDGLEAALTRRIANEADSAAAEGDTIHLGLALLDLQTGREIMIGADRSFHAASTMKVPVMLELYRQAEAHGFSVEDPLAIRNTFRSIADGSSYTLSSDRDTELVENIGGHLTYRRVAHTMITISSNLATNILIDELEADSIQATMERLGAGEMRVLRGVQDIPAFERGMSNFTSARAYARVLEAVARCEITSAEACAQMMEILEDQQFRSDIPAGLPEGTRVGNKTGSITGIRHDGAIVMPEGREAYVLVILTEGYGGGASRAMTELSRMIWEVLGTPVA